jgi:hypothetical protein
VTAFYEALYRDGSNNKTLAYLQVTDRPLTDTEKATILGCCERVLGEPQFVAEQIGATHPLDDTDWVRGEDLDHPWCILADNLADNEHNGWGLMRMWTGTAEQLVDAFRQASADGWQPTKYPVIAQEEVA